MRADNIRGNSVSLGLYTAKNEKKDSLSAFASEQKPSKLAGEKSANFEWNTTQSPVDIPIRDGSHTSGAAMHTQIPSIEFSPAENTFSALDTEKRGLDGLTAILEERLTTTSTSPTVAKEIDNLKDAMAHLFNEIKKNAIYEKPEVNENSSTSMLDKYAALSDAAKSAKHQAKSISTLAKELHVMVRKEGNSDHDKLTHALNTISNIYQEKAKIYRSISDIALLDETSVYDRNNKLKHIFDNPYSSSSSTETGIKAKFGGGLPTYGTKLLGAPVSASLTVNVGGKHSTEVNMKNSAGSTTKKDTLSAGVDARVGIKGASVSAGVTGSMSVAETYDTGKTNPERDFAIIEAMEESRRGVNLPFLRGPKQGLQHFANVTVNEFLGHPRTYPKAPTHIDANRLTQAQGSHLVLDALYKEIGIDISQGNVEKMSPLRLDLPSSTAPSLFGKAKSSHISTRNGDIKLSANATIGQPGKPLGMPDFGMSANAAVAAKFTQKETQTNTTSAELLSLDNIPSTKQAQEIASLVSESVWLRKSNGDVNNLPRHLQATYALVDKINTDLPNVDAALTQVSLASTALDELTQSYQAFSAHAARWVSAEEAYQSNSSADNLARLKNEIDAITPHLFLKDRIPDSFSNGRERVKFSKEAIAMTLDGYSTALGVINLAGLSRVFGEHGRTKENNSSLAQATISLAEKSKSLLADLKNIPVPIPSEVLNRSSALVSLKNSEKMDFSIDGKGQVGVSFVAPLDGAEIHNIKGIPGGAGYIEGNMGSASVLNRIKGTSVKNTVVTSTNQPFGRGNFISTSTVINTTTPQLKNPESSFLSRNMHRLSHLIGASTHGRDTTVTTDKRNGKVMTETTTTADSRSTNISTPNLAEGTAAKVNISASKVVTNNITTTKMGDELSANVENFSELKDYDLDSKIIATVKDLMPPILTNTDENNNTVDLANNEADNVKALKDKFKSFFEAVESNDSIKSKYFGFNALGGILNAFSQIKPEDLAVLTRKENGHFEFDQFDVLSKTATDEFFARKTLSQNSAKNMLSTKSLFLDGDIFSYMGTKPEAVGKLLQEKVNDLGTTAMQFLEKSSPEERAAFFKNEPLGIKLFANYLMVLDTVNDLQSTLTNKSISLSPFAQSSISDKVQARVTQEKSNGGQGMLLTALKEKHMPIPFRSSLK